MFAIFAIFIGMPWAIFSGVAKIKKATAGSEGESLRKSELEAMIQSAVEEAVEPFQRRIETLEAIAIDDEAPQRRLDAAALADAFDPIDTGDEPAAVRRRTRE